MNLSVVSKNCRPALLISCTFLLAACNGFAPGSSSFGQPDSGNASSAPLVSLNALGLNPAPADGSASVTPLLPANLKNIKSSRQVDKIEAEQMSLSGFQVEKSSEASGGAYILADSASATASFVSPFPTGDYVLVLVPFRIQGILPRPAPTPLGAELESEAGGVLVSRLQAIDSASPGPSNPNQHRVVVFRLQIRKGDTVHIGALFAGQTIDYLAMIPMPERPFPRPSASLKPGPVPLPLPSFPLKPTPIGPEPIFSPNPIHTIAPVRPLPLPPLPFPRPTPL